MTKDIIILVNADFLVGAVFPETLQGQKLRKGSQSTE